MIDINRNVTNLQESRLSKSFRSLRKTFAFVSNSHNLLNSQFSNLLHHTYYYLFKSLTRKTFAKRKKCNDDDDKKYVIDNNNDENELQKLKEKLTKLAKQNKLLIALLQSMMQNNTIDKANDAIKLLKTKVCKKLNCISSYEIDL